MLGKKMKKVGAWIMLASIFSLIGCSAIDKTQAADVESLLEEKYNKEFKVTHIGERYGTASNDTATTYVHPADNKNLVFSAVMDKDRKLVADSLIPRLIGDKINEILKQNLASEGIESETFTFVMKADSSAETNPEITLEDYVKTYKPGYFSGHMIVKEKPGLTAAQFEKALNAVYKAGLNTTYQVKIKVISEDEYEKCRKEFVKLPEVSSSWFNDYKVVNDMVAVMDEKGYHTSEEDGE